MSKLFILGAGFSRAVSCHMPTMPRLNEYIRGEFSQLPITARNRALYRKLSLSAGGIESLLSYLYQTMPWKDSWETNVDNAALLDLSELIANYITECEVEVFEHKGGLPAWTKDFVEYLHREKLTVATLNYDTVLERLCYLHLPQGYNSANAYYEMPVTHLAQRFTSTTGIPQPNETYKLFKLHGSINFYFSGDKNIPSEQVYYVPIQSRSPRNDYERDQVLERCKMDLTRLVIPPVTEKTSFYGSNLIKTMWTKLREEIDKANEIYCIGYSLPKTDLTMSLFLATTVRNKKVYIVDPATCKARKRLEENYTDIFGKRNLRLRYLGKKDAVMKMVKELT
ncbi:hypothetical protein ACFL6S_03540 [Candidatus Poribacteria bacterium]